MHPLRMFKAAASACSDNDFLSATGRRAASIFNRADNLFFNHAWGWYAGSIYDEGLIPDGRLGFFRLGTVIRSLALLVVLQMLRKLTARAAPLISVVIIIAWFGESKLAIEGHYYVDRDQIETILSERVELDGLVLHLDPSISEPRRQRIIVEHAYRLEQLARLHQGLIHNRPSIAMCTEMPSKRVL